MRAFMSTDGYRSSIEPRRLPGQTALPIRERIALQAEAAEREARRILAETEPYSENANHYALPCAIGWPVGLPYTKSMTGGPLWKHVVANRSANCGTYVILEPGDDTEALADALRAFVEGD